MPSIQANESAIHDGLSYPGKKPDWDAYVVLPGWYYRVQPNASSPGQWHVVVDGGPLSELRDRKLTVDDVLQLRDTTSPVYPNTSTTNDTVAARQPDLAIGSNGDPAQLQTKLGGKLWPGVLVAKASVANAQLAYADRINHYGAFPYYLVASPHRVADVQLVYCNNQQREIIDATEGAGGFMNPSGKPYSLAYLNTNKHPVRLTSNVPVDSKIRYYAINVADGFGVLRDHRGNIIEASSQKSIHTYLRSRGVYAHAMTNWTTSPERFPPSIRGLVHIARAAATTPRVEPRMSHAEKQHILENFPVAIRDISVQKTEAEQQVDEKLRLSPTHLLPGALAPYSTPGISLIFAITGAMRFHLSTTPEVP